MGGGVGECAHQAKHRIAQKYVFFRHRQKTQFHGHLYQIAKNTVTKFLQVAKMPCSRVCVYYPASSCMIAHYTAL